MIQFSKGDLLFGLFMNPDPSQDGITHINIYTKGKTKLGRALSNLSSHSFTYEPYGFFKSVEAFWYYYLTGCQHDELKLMNGFDAKKQGKKYRDDRIDKDGLSQHDKEVILGAIRCKLNNHKEIKQMMSENNLPFAHYYFYGQEDNAKVTELPQYSWIVDYFTDVSTYLKTGIKPKKTNNSLIEKEKIEAFACSGIPPNDVILIITYKELNKETGLEEVLVSHGVDFISGKNIVLPQITIEEIGAKISNEYGLFITKTR